MDNPMIRNEIESTLEKSTFVLTEFDYDPELFGNIIVVLNNGNKKYRFVTDRGEIWCNHKLIFLSDYHVAGVDDTPVYLMKAIQQILDEKKVNIGQCLEVTRYIFNKLLDLVDLDEIFISSDSNESEGVIQHFNSVVLDKERKIKFEVFDNENEWILYLDHDHFAMKMDDDSGLSRADSVVVTLRRVFSCPIKAAAIYRGKNLKMKILYVYENNQWLKISTTLFSYPKLFNPFTKKSVEEIHYDFRKQNTEFIKIMNDSCD